MKRFLSMNSCIILFGSHSLFAQNESYGTPITGLPVIEMTTGQLMEHWMPIVSAELKRRNIGLGLKEPNRENLPQAPGAQELSQWPPAELKKENGSEQILAPQALGINFTGATLAEAGAFPPDVMGAAGPTQYLVFINGILRSFSKTTGLADGVLNIDPDIFFGTITTPPGTNEVTYTTDPNVRYDRLSGRWFLTIIDMTLSTISPYPITKSNRLLFAISDGPIITSSTIWRLIYYQNTSNFDDYPSLGIDADGLYIGSNRFTVAGSFVNCRGYVFNKASFISGSPTGTIFDNLLFSNAGPFSPRGVDNPDPLNTGVSAVGYFIGVDNAT